MPSGDAIWRRRAPMRPVPVWPWAQSPSACPTLCRALPSRTSIASSSLTSSPKNKGKHTFKFGGDVNIVHEVMINLFQGGGIYCYGDTNNADSLPGLDH